MTIYLMDILVSFLPEYDHCTSRGPSDEKLSAYWQWGLVCGSLKLQTEAFVKCLTHRILVNPKFTLTLFEPQISNKLIYLEHENN